MTPTAASRLRGILASGKVVRSTFVKLASLEVIDILHSAGLDAVVVDLEHSQLSEAEARRLVRYSTALGLPSVVRLPGVDSGLVNRLLEAGAAGIQLSTVTRRDQVEALVAACRFPPHGRRSLSLAHPGAGYGADTVSAHLARIREGPLIVVQVETAKTDDPLPLILAGTDVAFVGTTDLAVDLGASGPDDPAVAHAISHIAEGVAASGPPTVLGGWAPSEQASASLIALGARYLTIGSDLSLLAGAIRDHLVRSADKEEI